MKTQETDLALKIYTEERDRLCATYNRMIGGALVVGWLGVVLYTFLTSPSAWSASQSAAHPNLKTAVVLGFLVGGLPGLFGLLLSKAKPAPYILAVGQMLLVGLLVHLAHGRIEMHFAYFGSLALLTSYRDWRIIVVASAVAAVDHLIRGLFMPYSIFGSDQIQIWRVVEHAFWVIWEDVFLIYSCTQGTRQLHRLAQQSEQQQMNAVENSRRSAALFQSAESLNDVSRHLMSDIRGLVQGVSDSLNRAKQVAFEMASVSGQLLEVDRSAKEVSETMTESSATASRGDAAAEQAMSEVKKLLESSRQITGVLETVQDLAFQTNLLSINASIEAARVGEVGAGFAVVATEVRLLAERSRESVDAIEQKIFAIQKTISSVGTTLGDICGSVRHIAEVTNATRSSANFQASTLGVISHSTTSAKSSAELMLKAMDDVHRLSETAAAEVTKASELATMLRDLAVTTVTTQR
jgi:methyl-accepting chemotaxis protein